MNMDQGQISPRLGDLIDRYHAAFRDNPDDGFSLFETTLDEDALIVRLERALKEGKPYNPRVEEWSPELRKQVESGAILL
jgi:hypothetical protein